jgi:hypothetical protein
MVWTGVWLRWDPKEGYPPKRPGAPYSLIRLSCVDSWKLSKNFCFPRPPYPFSASKTGTIDRKNCIHPLKLRTRPKLGTLLFSSLHIGAGSQKRKCGLKYVIHTYEKAVVKSKSSINCLSGALKLGSSPNTYS